MLNVWHLEDAQKIIVKEINNTVHKIYLGKRPISHICSTSFFLAANFIPFSRFFITYLTEAL